MYAFLLFIHGAVVSWLRRQSAFAANGLANGVNAKDQMRNQDLCKLTYRYPPGQARGGRRVRQYVPSSANTGLRVRHAPSVKSGKSTVWKFCRIEASDSGVIALQVTAS